VTLSEFIFIGAEWRSRVEADLKNAIRERDRSSPGDREEAKMARNTAGVTGMRLALDGLIGAPASGTAPVPGVVLGPVCAAAAAEEAESGYGRCDDGRVDGAKVVAVAVVAAAYVAGVMVLVLGVELVGVRTELLALELDRTEDEGEATMVCLILVLRLGGGKGGIFRRTEGIVVAGATEGWLAWWNDARTTANAPIVALSGGFLTRHARVGGGRGRDRLKGRVISFLSCRPRRRSHPSHPPLVLILILDGLAWSVRDISSLAY
jgi:hypothetical protein